MNSIRIIHTADCHLGSSRKNVSGGKKELINTFFRILDLCRKHRIDFLLIAGDLFDSPFVDRDTVNEVTSAIAEIPDTNVIIVSGNHDCACVDSVYDTCTFPPNVHLFTSAMDFIDFPDKNTCIYGAGFTSSHSADAMLGTFSVNSTDRINIGVLHGEMVSANLNSLYNPISEPQIAASHLDYLALGHIHKRSDIQKSGNTFYSYCGCIDGRGFDETGSMGVYMGTLSKGECRLEFVELSSRLYITDKIDVSGCTSSLAATDTILRHIKKNYGGTFAENLYKLTLHGSISPDIILNTAQIQSELSKTLQYCEVSDCTEAEFSDLEALSKEPTLRGVFVRKMLSRLETAPPEQHSPIQEALRLGLRAFEREVTLLED